MKRVALIVGGSIGNEIVPPVLDVVRAAGAEVDWLRVDVPAAADRVPDDLLDGAIAAVRECGIGLKTKLIGPAGHGLPDRGDAPGPSNPNVLLRQRLGLYAGVRPIRSLPGLSTRYPDLDLIVIRENTEDIYKGIEHEIVPGVVQSLKVVTRQACDRIARYAFKIAGKLGRQKITFIHKGNIMKRADGLFLDTVRMVAKEHLDLGYEEMIVDAACMQLVLDPYQFDILLTGNLYGDILSNLGSGLAGGISGAHSINIGDDCRVFEAIHGEAPHLVGTGRANPLPLLSPAIALLRDIGEATAADRIQAAVTQVLEHGDRLSPDLGGKATTRQMCDGIVEAMGGGS